MSSVLVATSVPALVDQLVRLVAAAGAPHRHVRDWAGALSGWRDAPVVLLGDDIARTLGQDQPIWRRQGVLVVADGLDDASIWQRAVSVGAERVVTLPDDSQLVVDCVIAALGPDPTSTPVVGVVGGRGGAGATCLAVAIALAGVDDDREVLLVDLDPLGGGVDLALGAEGVDGVRWPEVAQLAGRADVLGRRLPQVQGLSVLSAARGGGPLGDSQVITSVLQWGRRASELVVADLPRAFDQTAGVVLRELTQLLVVVPAEVRAVAAAAEVAARAAAFTADIRLVVRAPASAALDAAEIADLVGVPLAAEMRPDRALAGELERGDPPARRRRSPLHVVARDLVRDLPPVLRVQRASG